MTHKKLVSWLWGAKDGGAESNSRMWGFECKHMCSVLVLSFIGPSREAFHTHAFNSVSWLLRGYLAEHFYRARRYEAHVPSLRPIVTRRSTFHMVDSPLGCSWVLTFRGPWQDSWREFLPKLGRFVKLTHGRKEV